MTINEARMNTITEIPETITTKVLVSKKGEKFSAHSLETNTIGYGKTVTDSVDQLAGLILTTVAACKHIDHPEAVFLLEAPEEQFIAWEEEHQKGSEDAMKIDIDTSRSDKYFHEIFARLLKSKLERGPYP